MEIRVVDYIANFLVKKGINHIFLVTGGGAMFLNDGVADCDGLNGISLHHEQAAAMAAVGYAKHKYTVGAAMLTTGCGGTNAITGLLNAYQDNIPCIFISGQTKRKETVHLASVPLRQFGVQEADILPIVDSLTKYSVMITDPKNIDYELEKAYQIAISGRPGPVWIDVPLDIQGAIVDVDALKKFTFDDNVSNENSVEAMNKKDIENILNEIGSSERPLVIAGQGIKLSKTTKYFKQFIEKNNIPYVATKLGVDILPSNHPLFIGRIGNKGDRPGNFAVQNADYILVLGSRLSVSSTGHEYGLFAREAKITVIDIDKHEHQKNTVHIDKFIHGNLRNFFDIIEKDFDYKKEEDIKNNKWLEICNHWKNKWNIFLPEYDSDKDGINLYKFMESLSNTLKSKATIISDAGSSFYVSTQAMKFKKDQCQVTTGAQAEMGFSLPAAIGVAFSADSDEQVIAITGDGSLQMNIQEFQTLVYHKIPVKLVVWNNDGYLSIRASQRKFFENSIGTDETNGVSFPNLEKISKAYGIKYISIKKIDEMEKKIDELYNSNEPVICELFSIRDQEIIPSVSSLKKEDGTMVSKPLEDMYPFLPRDEFYKEMLIKPLDE